MNYQALAKRDGFRIPGGIDGSSVGVCSIDADAIYDRPSTPVMASRRPASPEGTLSLSDSDLDMATAIADNRDSILLRRRGRDPMLQTGIGRRRAESAGVSPVP